MSGDCSSQGHTANFSRYSFAVDGGHCAVIWHRFSGGVQSFVVGEGTHFRIPLITYPTIFDVRIRPRVIASRTGTKDLQQVQISLRVLSRPIEDKLPEIMVVSYEWRCIGASDGFCVVRCAPHRPRGAAAVQ